MTQTLAKASEVQPWASKPLRVQGHLGAEACTAACLHSLLLGQADRLVWLHACCEWVHRCAVLCVHAYALCVHVCALCTVRLCCMHACAASARVCLCSMCACM